MTTATQTPATGAADPAPAAAPAPEAGANPLLTAASAAAPAADAPATPAATDPAAAPAADAQKADDKPQGAPEQYADFTVPEGVTLDAAAVDEFKALAKEHNLSQEAAQKFAELGIKATQNVEARYAEHVKQAKAQWAEDSRADKEFGGDKLEENLATAKKALDAFSSPEFSKLLAESGFGNHPEVIRTFYRVGKAISEDRLVTGATRPADAGDAAKRLFPNMN